MSLAVREGFAAPPATLEKKRRTRRRLSRSQECAIRRTAAWWAKLHARYQRAEARYEALVDLANDSNGDTRGTPRERAAYHRSRVVWEGTMAPLQSRLYEAWNLMAGLLREVGLRVAIVGGQIFHAWDDEQSEEYDLLPMYGQRADTGFLNLDAEGGRS